MDECAQLLHYAVANIKILQCNISPGDSGHHDDWYDEKVKCSNSIRLLYTGPHEPLTQNTYSVVSETLCIFTEYLPWFIKNMVPMSSYTFPSE